MVPDDKIPPLLQFFPTCSAQLPKLFLLFYAGHRDLFPRASGDSGASVGGLRVQNGQSSPHTLPCHHGCTADSPHLPCLTPHSPALAKPPSSLPSSHVSTPPSGSSKYFPSLLFEASIGHGTSCTNHAGLPWGGRSERTAESQTHRNPICTVFIRGYFSCQDSHH